MKHNKLYLTILIILNIISSFLLIYQAFLFKDLINNAVNQIDIKNQIIWIVIIVSLAILDRILYMFIRNKYSLSLEVKMKGEIFRSIINKKYKEIDHIHSAELSNIYLTDVKNIADAYSFYIPNLFLYTSRIILAFVGLIILKNYIVILLSLVGALLYIASRIYGKKAKKLNKAALESDDELNLYMQESIENIKLLKIMSNEKDMQESLSNVLNKNLKKKNARNKYSIFANIILSTSMTLLYVGAMCYCAYLIYLGEIEYGTLTALVSLVSCFEAPIAQLSSSLGKIYAAKASKERILELQNKVNEEKSYNLTDFDSIVIKDLNFKYNDHIIFNGFNYTINKNDIVIIKGSSGIGKTTLINLLFGFYDYDGDISILYQGNTYKVSERSRNLFSYVPQENILFTGTILSNIKMFNKNATNDEIIEALKLVNIYDEIMALDNGINHQIHERGKGLSIGQIQRILIAIALLSDAPILVMDEFTSALDYENERIISQIVSNLNKTVIMVSHRDIEIKNAKILNLGEKNDN